MVGNKEKSLILFHLEKSIECLQTALRMYEQTKDERYKKFIDYFTENNSQLKIKLKKL